MCTFLCCFLHCLYCSDVSAGDIEVRLGKLYINKRERGREQIIRPDRFIIHPNFSAERNDYDRDVALIHLRSSAVYTDYVRPICLPLKKNDADKIMLRPGTIGVITGGSIEGFQIFSFHYIILRVRCTVKLKLSSGVSFCLFSLILGLPRKNGNSL